MSVHPELVTARNSARAVLARLSVIAEAPAANPSPGGRGKPGHVVLCGTLPERARTHSYWLGRFREHWHNAHDLAADVVSARKEAESLTGRASTKRVKAAIDTPAGLNAWIVKDGKGLTVAQCARTLNVTERQVREARDGAGKDIADGTNPNQLPEHDRLAEARRLRGLEVSYKEIGRRLAMSGEGIRQMLRKAA